MKVPFDNYYDRSFISSSVVNELRRRLVLNQIPAGEKLVELQLAEALNVSRGPIRNALLLLEKEGLVRFLPTGRTEAAGFSLQDAEKLYEARLYLETKAIEKACSHTLKDVSRWRNVIAELKRGMDDVARFSQLDIQFHYELMLLSENKYLIQCWSVLRPLMETILLITNSHFRDSDKERDEGYIFDLHEKIVNAVVVGDVFHAVSYIREHLDSAKTYMLETLELLLAAR